jgi:hypothetical protein
MTPPSNSREDETLRYAVELAAAAEPVRRVPRLRVVASAAILAALSCVAVAVAVTGVRADVAHGAMSLPYLVVLLGLGVFALGGLLAALGASIPGRERVWRAGAIALGLSVVLWLVGGLGLLAGGLATGPVNRAWLDMSLTCLGIATGVGFIPAIALISFVLGAFPYRPGVAAAIGGAAMVAFGSGAVHLTCSVDELFHLSLAHVVGPLAAGALLGSLLVYTRRGPEA